MEVLVERCEVEPDFFVRDMLTWAVTRHPTTLTLPRLHQELGADAAQARSQALHTLSKIGDQEAWSAITTELLRDQDPDVARSAWRAAVALVPQGSEGTLAQELASQLGRGQRDLQLSLSRAIAALGEAARPALEEAARVGNAGGRAHAVATLRLLDHPEESFDVAVHEAQRFLALTRSPLVDRSHADR
ncbi:HEAT repeat domain-containing protein [Nakamurella sp. GG22]